MCCSRPLLAPSPPPPPPLIPRVSSSGCSPPPPPSQEEKARELRLATEQNHSLEIALATTKSECDSLRTLLVTTKEDAEARVKKWKAKVATPPPPAFTPCDPWSCCGRPCVHRCCPRCPLLFAPQAMEPSHTSAVPTAPAEDLVLKLETAQSELMRTKSDLAALQESLKSPAVCGTGCAFLF
jgi:hypothetical protein